MAKRYTAKLPVRCWKTHTCVGCGAAYAYILSRNASGTGGSAEAAQSAVVAAAKRIAATQTDMEPCPTCGLYQPDMIGQRRSRTRMQIVVVALLVLGVILILRASDALQANVLTWVAVLVCAAVAFLHFMLDVRNPNADLTANVRRAADEMAAGKLRHTPGDNRADPQPFAHPERSIVHKLALLLLIAAVLATAAPELARSVHQWPLNAACYPPVVGPSDHTRVYMTDSVTSVKGYWKGVPNVVLHYEGEPAGGARLDATTNNNVWGDSIQVDSNSSKESTSHPWVSVTLPADPALSGKAATCDIAMLVMFPRLEGSSNFVEDRKQMSQSVAIALAPAGAGDQYNTLWWAGTVCGGLLAGACGIMLYAQARGMTGKAKPTQVTAV